MIDQLLCSTIPTNCVALCLLSANNGLLLCRSGQCLLMGEDLPSLVHRPEDLKRVIVRGEHACSTAVSNLRPWVAGRLLECLLHAAASPGDPPSPDAPLFMLDLDNPGPIGTQLLNDAPEVERFARLLLRAQAATRSTEPEWATPMGLDRAPRQARETLLAAVAAFATQVGNPSLAAQATGFAQALRDRDAAVGKKPRSTPAGEDSIEQVDGPVA